MLPVYTPGMEGEFSGLVLVAAFGSVTAACGLAMASLRRVGSPSMVRARGPGRVRAPGGQRPGQTGGGRPR